MASDDSSTSQKPLGWGQQKAVILKTFCPKSGSLATGQWHDRVLKEQLREEDFLKNQDNVHSSEKKTVTVCKLWNIFTIMIPGVKIVKNST